MKNDYCQNYFVVIPACNEELRLGRFLRKVKRITKKIIVVDDGSVDNTGKIAKQAGVRVFRHELNLGKGAAMKTGAIAAFKLGAKNIIFMDADGQHDPKHIPEFLRKLDKGYDVVFGTREMLKEVPFMNRLGNRFGSVILKLVFGIYRADPFCGYLAIKRNMFSKICWDSSGYGVETEIVAKVGKYKIKYTEIPIPTIYLDKHKGMTIFDTLEIILSIPRLKFQ